MQIHIASRSDIEYFAVCNCYLKECHDSKSGVDNQPIGMEMIEKGALNRLNCVPHFPCVAFETGMVLTKNGNYQDISCIMLRTHIGDFCAWTPLVMLQDYPLAEIIEWKQLTAKQQQNTTLGSMIAQNYKTRADDWYLSVGGEFSRRDVLMKIFNIVWEKFIRTYETLPVLDVKMQLHNNVPFIDIQHNLLYNPLDLATAVKHLADRILFDTVVIIDARGFLLAGEFMKNQIRVVMARKPNKLPSQVYTQSYEKEYGSDEICIEVDAIPKNSSVLVLDDIIATGGTMRAVMDLVESKFQSNVVAFIAPFAIETSPGKLMCNKLPLEKVRFAQTQLLLPEWKFQNIEENEDEDEEEDEDEIINIIPPSLNSFSSKDIVKRATVSWKQFNSSSNITFNGNDFFNKHVVIYLNATNQSELYEALSLLKILYRKNTKSISVVIPFTEQGTQDRIEYNNENGMETLAQIDTLAKLIGKQKVYTYDLHAEQSILAFHDLENYSIVQSLWDMFHHFHPNTIPVFPDDGSCKRYANLLKVKKTCITFRKTRGEGDIRLVETEDKTVDQQDYVIVDDISRTGSTMHNVAQYLLQKRNAKTVSALFAHAPFEPKCCKNLKIFEDRIWTSNSCPEKVPSRWAKYCF